jgi:hypothetical protein
VVDAGLSALTCGTARLGTTPSAQHGNRKSRRPRCDGECLPPRRRSRPHRL